MSKQAGNVYSVDFTLVAGTQANIVLPNYYTSSQILGLNLITAGGVQGSIPQVVIKPPTAVGANVQYTATIFATNTDTSTYRLEWQNFGGLWCT